LNVVTKLIHKLMNGYYLSLTNEVKGIVYLPLLFRPKRKSYSRSELEARQYFQRSHYLPILDKGVDLSLLHQY